MRRLAVTLLAVLAVACSPRPTPTPVSPDPETAWQVRRSSLAALTNWTATGRVIVKTEERGWKATLNWVQRDGAYRIRLTAPLGQGTVQLSGDDRGVVMRTSDERMYWARDPETLLLDTVGWSVPVEGLRYWMRGLDAPDTPSTAHLDDLGRLDNLAQSGWVIEYERYTDVRPVELPAKLVLANERVDLRIVINRWDLDAP